MDNQTDYNEYDHAMIHVFDSVRHYIEEHELLKIDFHLTMKMYRSYLGNYQAYVTTDVISDRRIYEVDYTVNKKITTVSSYLQEIAPVSYNE